MPDPGCDSTQMDRKTICFSDPDTQTVLHNGDLAFKQEISRLYNPAESVALEQLIELKTTLAPLPTDEYFTALTEGLSLLLGADLTFVIKRVLLDEQDAAIEMPPHGEPGSCMMAAAFHYCASDGTRSTTRGNKFHAWGCPCAYMRHDKVFLIPDNLDNFITNNPNQVPTPCEAYIAVPLFAEGKCFAHFGAMWSKERAGRRSLSWAFIEALLHALEDAVVSRLTEGANFVKAVGQAKERPRIIPHEAVTIAQSLRPYAGSLSHELRTPMQGIVGMLDVMYATVQDAVEAQPDPRMRKIFEGLMENIEVVQDSSRRAIEAADNVVHAYDMDMSIPEGPSMIPHEDSNESMSPIQHDKRPEILVAGSNLPIPRGNKRRREESSSRHGSSASQHKIVRLEGAGNVWSRVASVTADKPAPEVTDQVSMVAGAEAIEDAIVTPTSTGSMRTIAPGLRHANLREVIQYVIDEGLKTGGRPDSVYATETDHGEIIEVRSRGSDGTASSKSIEWTIDPSVPNTMFVDEKDLSKLVSCVFLNAVKFTGNVDGRVTIRVTMSSRARYISIKIGDNGPGIPAAFLPKLFKPFSQQNPSLTRQSEGLGLGLMVAKGIARKLEGDLMCTKAETEGARRGTEFEIKVPIAPGESISRPTSPFGSPRPRTLKPIFAESTLKPESTTSQPRSAQRALSADRSPKARNSPALDGTCHSCAEVISFREGLAAPFSASSPKSVRISEPEGDSVKAPPSSTTSPATDSESTFRPRIRKSVSAKSEIDRNLAARYPLTIMVVEDNKINRKLLVNMLVKLGYRDILEAHDGAEAVRQMAVPRPPGRTVDVVLMDLWMPLMDGYEATERILSVNEGPAYKPTVLAVTADVTDGALERAAQVGMTGFMTKPYKMADLQRLITEYCAGNSLVSATA